MAATPRLALLRRRDRYLARVSSWDWNPIPLEWDDRPADVRGFRGGGDDFPPQCRPEADRAKPRPIHRPRGPKPDADAKRRLNSNRTARGDYEVFALAPHGDIGLTRITAILARAVNHWRPGTSAEPHLYFDVGLKTFPTLDEKGDALAKAWMLFERVGLDTAPLLNSVEAILARAPWDLDPWTVTNPPKEEKCKDRFTDLHVVVVDAIKRKLRSYTDANHVPWPQDPPGTDPTTPEGMDPCHCAAKPEEPTKPECPSPPKIKDPDVSLPAALTTAADAMLAAFGDAAGEACISDLRELGFAEPLIGRILSWMAAVWNTVGDDERRAQATSAWNDTHGVTALHAGRVSLVWQEVPPALYAMRALAHLSRRTRRIPSSPCRRRASSSSRS